MRVVVSDTSALIDLERGDLLELAFKLPLQLCVPDLLYERELAANIGPSLLGLGLTVESLSADAVGRAQEMWAQHKVLSLPDCLAFALAQERGWMLLTGDGALRAVAEAARLDCHGFFWLFDLVEAAKLVSSDVLATSLDKLSSHPRCRLPARMTAKRLKALRS